MASGAVVDAEPPRPQVRTTSGGTVPLSDHEEQLLSQMEQQLLQDDPKFASAMRGARGARGGRRILVGAAGVLVGMGLLVVAVVAQLIFLAVPGFLLMLAGVTYAFSRPRQAQRSGPIGVVGSDGTPRARRASDRGAAGGGFMQRLEERWERRRGEWR
jgi:hypothetical protein